MTNERWKGRNTDKDTLRREVWSALETSKAGIEPIWSAIPNFFGAHTAAEKLATLPFWKSAKVVKCNPDAPQIPVRLKALQEGKLVYTPVPELVQDFPFLLLDPEELKKNGVSFEEAAVSSGALKHGKRVQFDEMLPMDVCVVGCVAVTREGGRTGKGGGFADLELGIFREVGTIPEHAPIVTTVHDVQVVENEKLIMLEHDSALHWIVTPNEIIETHTPYPQPTGVAWDLVQADQYRDVPFLNELRAKLTKKAV
jgi:5-formyltetrahydrofolate cyclo-ligase